MTLNNMRELSRLRLRPISGRHSCFLTAIQHYVFFAWHTVIINGFMRVNQLKEQYMWT